MQYFGVEVERRIKFVKHTHGFSQSLICMHQEPHFHRVAGLKAQEAVDLKVCRPGCPLLATYNISPAKL